MSPPRAPLATLPLIRVFASARFRLLLAAGAVACGIGLQIVYFAILWGGYPPFLNDFDAYYLAAERLASATPLYTAAQISGAVDAVCEGCYLYPPPLAQALIPLTYLPVGVGQVIWFGATEAMAVASVWLATGIGGAQRSLERFLWSASAALLFTPFFYGNYYGNVGSLLALLVAFAAMGGVAAGIASALGLLIKVSPAGLAPAALAQGRRSRWAFVTTVLLVGAVSFVAAPQAWLDYGRVLPNLLAGKTDYYFNLAPANAASEAGLPDLVVSVVRMTALLAGVASMACSIWLARRPGGMPAAALAGTVAMLLVPSTLWAHYLAVLLPFAAMAWPGAGAWSKTVMLAGYVILTLTGLGQTDGLPHLGMLLMVAGSAWVLWPRSGTADEHERVSQLARDF